MKKIIGYMLTWTAYGSWLQGDRRKYVKDGQILDPNPSLENHNKECLQYPAVSLNLVQRELINKAIHEEAAELKQAIHALAVRTNHVHLVVDCNFISVASAVSHYKNAARLKLQENGFIGKLWTKGYSVRYCFNDTQLNNVIKYVNNHNAEHSSENPQLHVGG
ncbi:MAG: Transposase IS200 like protein [Planctomycetes bacterium ADurb.Bin401]|nr:MAG: Transposase IS200 like protein [Planctomycetes bacterium ADurb.Bin401]